MPYDFDVSKKQLEDAMRTDPSINAAQGLPSFSPPQHPNWYERVMIDPLLAVLQRNQSGGGGYGGRGGTGSSGGGLLSAINTGLNVYNTIKGGSPVGGQGQGPTNNGGSKGPGGIPTGGTSPWGAPWGGPTTPPFIPNLNFPGFQFGGHRPWGQPAIVGEDGPEAILPTQGGDYVLPLSPGSTQRFPPTVSGQSPGTQLFSEQMSPMVPPSVSNSGPPPQSIPPPAIDQPPPLPINAAQPPSISIPPGITPPANPVPPSVSQRPSVPPTVQNAQQQYQQILAQGMPQPKWWERALQAASMTKIGKPAAAFNTYPAREEQYKQRVGAAQIGVALAQANEEAMRKQRETEATLTMRRAQEEAARAKTGMADRVVVPAGATVYQDGQARYTAPNSRPTPETPEQKSTRLRGLADSLVDIGYITKGSPEWLKIAVEGKLPNVEKDSTAEAKRKMALDLKASRLGKKPEDLTIEEQVSAIKEFSNETKVDTPEPLYPVVSGDQVVYAPRSQASGKSAPRTLYDETGMANTGGRKGLSTTAPPAISDNTQKELAGINSSLKIAQSVDSKLSDPAFRTLGPVVGKIKMKEIRSLGGFGATKEQIDMATDLQRLISTQAFAEGGKQLTPTELRQFELVIPNMEDTLETAMIKSRKAIDYLKLKRDERFRMMPVRQRAQLVGSNGAMADQNEYQAGTEVVMVDTQGKRKAVPPDLVEKLEKVGWKREAQAAQPQPGVR